MKSISWRTAKLEKNKSKYFLFVIEARLIKKDRLKIAKRGIERNVPVKVGINIFRSENIPLTIPNSSFLFHALYK
jgi:hypothetical protein